MADVFSAIRTQDGWDSMTPEQQARYTYHFENLSSWESAIPADLVAEDESWIAECYNDWPAGLIDNLELVNRITSTTNNIIIKSYNVLDKMTLDGYCHLANANVSIINIDVIGAAEFSLRKLSLFDNTLGTTLNVSGVTVNDDQPKSTASTVYSVACNVDAIVSNTRVNHSSSRAFGGNSPDPTVAFYNCLSVGANTYGFVRFKTVNCIGVKSDINTDFVALGAGSSNNVSQDATGDIININLYDEFVDPDNEDYHLKSGSQLIGAGLNLIEEGLLTSPQYDLDGNQWPDTGPWDIGPYMYGDTEPPEPTDDLIRINGQAPDDIRINGQSVDTIRCNGEQLWP